MEPTSASPLQLTLLGGIDARRPGREGILLPAGKVQALLAFLARHPGQAHPRDKLAVLLWDDAPADRARHRLRQALLELRRALTPSPVPPLIEDGDALALDPRAVAVDVHAFETAVTDGTPLALEQAAALYRGDFLAGLRVQAAAFEEWLLGEREALRELALEALGKLVAHHVRSDAVDAAVRTTRQLLGVDPTQEAAHRTLMRLYLRQGRRGAALRQYQACVGVLQREVGTLPEPETRTLYRELLQAPVATAAARHGSITDPAASMDRVDVPQPVGPLLGREAEMERLGQAREEAWRGRGRMAFVLGEAGIGKSRLVAELVADATKHRGRVVAGRAYETEQATPFGPWVEALRTGGVIEDIVPGLDRPVLTELGRLFPELDAPRSPAGPSPEGHTRLFEALAQVFQRLCAAGPLVVVLEDLHWADGMSLRLLGFVARRASDWPLLLVGTAREEELAGVPLLRRILEEVGRGPGGVALRLAPLSRQDTLALVETHARPGDRGDRLSQLAERAWSHSEGNPFVVIETIRALHDSEIPAAPGDLALPRSVAETIERRLERLGEWPRQVAGVAAVIGRQFDFELLCRVLSPNTPEVAEAVEALVDRGLLHVSGERLDFTHERIQEVAYGRVVTPMRRLWHQRVAESLEVRSREQREPPQPEVLAHHFTAAGLAPRALEYLYRAGRRAIEQSAYGEAVTHLRRGLELLPELADPRTRLRHELGLRLGLGETLIVTKGYAAPEVEAAFARARALCVEVGEAPFPAVSGLFHYFLTRGDVQAGRALAEQLLQLAGEGGPAEQRVIAHLARGDAAFWGGEFLTAREHLAHAIALDEGGASAPGSFAGHDAAVVGGLYDGVACWFLGLPDTALARIEGAHRRARDLEHPHSVNLAVFFRAWTHRLRGELNLARAGVEEMLSLSTRRAFSFWVTVATFLKGLTRAEQGDRAAGIADMDEALVAYRATGAALGLTYFLALLAEARGRAGRPDEGLDTLSEAEVAVRANDERFYEAELHRLKGELLATLGTDRDVEVCFRESLRVARQQGARALELRAATSLGQWLQRAGRQQEACAVLAEPYQWFTEGLETWDLRRAREVLAGSV